MLYAFLFLSLSGRVLEIRTSSDLSQGEIVHRIPVQGKRDARRIAMQMRAKAWNF